MGEARAKVLEHARRAGLPDDPTPLHAGGRGATAYADAVATYLAFSLSRIADRHSTLTRWDPNPNGVAPKIANTFSRQALPLVGDFAEGNPFSKSSGNSGDTFVWNTKMCPIFRVQLKGTLNA